MSASVFTRMSLAAAVLLDIAGCGADTLRSAQGAGGVLASTGGGGAESASGGNTMSGSDGATMPVGNGGVVGAGGNVVGMGGSVVTGGATGSGGAGGASLSGGAGGMSSGGSAGADGGTGAADCDRACLIGVMSTYLNALAARDPMMVPVAPALKYTDNGATAKLGDGLWKTASQLVAGERMDYADPTAGQVGSQLVVNENGTTPVIYMVRLKVVSHQITEIESMTVRQAGAANGFFSPQNMKPQPVFFQAVDPAKRLTRDQLKAEVDLYIGYLDGKTAASGVHFDSMCARFENGVETATGLASFQSQHWMFNVTARYLVFDEETGLVWGMFPFSPGASSLVVGELFKVVDSRIMMIQAVMATIPTTAWN